MIVVGRLERTGTEKFELRPFRQKRINFTIDELISNPMFAFFRDDPPSEYPDFLDRLGIRDRLNRMTTWMLASLRMEFRLDCGLLKGHPSQYFGSFLRFNSKGTLKRK